MNRILRKAIVCLLALSTCTSIYSNSEFSIDERLLLVKMRAIGHQILLAGGDSTSVVLPVEKIGDRYLIQLDAPFELIPSNIINASKQIMQQESGMIHHLVEIEDCLSKQIVYSYEMSDSSPASEIACGKRDQPKKCYSLYVTIDPKTTNNEANIGLVAAPNNNPSGNGTILWIILGALAIVAAIFFYRNRYSKPREIDNDRISLGNYEFDHRTMELYHQDEKIELTSKESDLLYILYSSANTTLERDTLLKKVWGNEGDYVGRTLDVFISKLRKKLEADEDVRIINIRGVGYKLVLAS